MEKNQIGNTIKGLGWIIIVLGVMVSFIMGGVMEIDFDYNYILAITGIVSSVVFGILFLGLGEIINLLHISVNIQKKLLNNSQTSIDSFEKVEDELPQI